MMLKGYLTVNLKLFVYTYTCVFYLLIIQTCKAFKENVTKLKKILCTSFIIDEHSDDADVGSIQCQTINAKNTSRCASSYLFISFNTLNIQGDKGR